MYSENIYLTLYFQYENTNVRLAGNIFMGFFGLCCWIRKHIIVSNNVGFSLSTQPSHGYCPVQVPPFAEVIDLVLILQQYSCLFQAYLLLSSAPPKLQPLCCLCVKKSDYRCTGITVPDGCQLQTSPPPARDVLRVNQRVLVRLGLGWFGGVITPKAQKNQNGFEYGYTVWSLMCRPEYRQY